jgi:hypothetical protein
MTILDQAVTSQRSQALQKANRVRLAQARLKEEMADGRLSFAQALVDPRAQQMTTEKILLAIKGVGGWRVSSRLSEAEISPSRRIFELTENQLRILVRLFSY